MKKLIVFIIGLLLMMNLVAAADKAKYSPEGRLYGLHTAIDRIALALTFDKAAKAEKALSIAEERQLEAQEMALRGNLAMAEKAQKGHDYAIGIANNAIRDLASDGKADKAAKAVERLSKLQERIEQHREKVLEVKEAILENKNLTLNQSEHLAEVFSRILNRTDMLAQQAELKRENALLKYAAFANATHADIDRLRAELENTTGLSEGRKNRTEHQLDRAELKLNRTEEHFQNLSVRLNLTAEERAAFEERLNLTRGRLGNSRERAQEGNVTEQEAEDHGNEVSAIANTIGDSRHAGNFSETLKQLKEQIRNRQEERRQERTREKGNGEGSNKTDEAD